jgi:hypothetical protein
MARWQDAVQIKRAAGVPATPMLLVADSKGAISHATSNLATRLGTSVAALRAGTMMAGLAGGIGKAGLSGGSGVGGPQHALDTLLPPPFQRLHHQVSERHLT